MSTLDKAMYTTGECMDATLISTHPRWPSYFDPDILVYIEDWEISADGSALLLGTLGDFPPQQVKIETITRLPDQLLFLRGVYVPEVDAYPDDPAETYYGICSVWQLLARAPGLLSNYGRASLA